MPRRTAAHAPLPRRLRLRDAGGEPPLRRQRQPPHRAGRQDGRHADRRDQEPQQLPVRRAGPRVRGRAAVRAVEGGRHDDQGRPQGRPAAGTTPRASPSPSARRRRRPTTATSPSPTSCPSSSTTPGSPGSGRRSASCPPARRERFEAEYGLSPYDANVLVEQGQDVADYYDAVARATGEYKLASNWVQQDVLRTVKERKLTLAEFPVGPEALADLINRVKRDGAEHEPGARGARAR